MAAASGFTRASKKSPCPICGGIKWCGIKTDGSMAICMRISEGAIKQARNGGWIHILKETSGFRTRSCSHTIRFKKYRTEWSEFQAGPTQMVEILAHNLMLDTDSLVQLSAGHRDRKWFFPMFNAKREIIGVRYRSSHGAKFCETGSRLGLFIPKRPLETDTIHVTEGESDTAALLSMGLYSIGVPGAGQASNLVADFVRGRSLSVIIVGDSDDIGRECATMLASKLSLYSPCVKLIFPPEGIEDARAWLHQDATREHIQQVASSASPVRLKVVS